MSSFDLFTAAIAAKHLLASQPQTFEIEQIVAMLDEAIDSYMPF